MDKVNVRLDRQCVAIPDKLLQTVFGSTTTPFPSDIASTAFKLLGECVNGGPSKPDTPWTPRKGFQAWGNANPFQPMFLEWEATYYHIDRTKWNVGVRPNPVGHAHSQVRFGVDRMLSTEVPDGVNQRDFRNVSGRTLILPQPVFSLESAVLDVLDSSDPSINLTPAQIQKIKDNIRKLTFISSPLSGLTEHLLTRVMGTHVKPTINRPGKSVIPLRPAQIQAQDIGFTMDLLSLVDSARYVNSNALSIRMSADSS
jgi:hypothetical protein